MSLQRPSGFGLSDPQAADSGSRSSDAEGPLPQEEGLIVIEFRRSRGTEVFSKIAPPPPARFSPWENGVQIGALFASIHWSFDDECIQILKDRGVCGPRVR